MIYVIVSRNLVKYLKSSLKEDMPLSAMKTNRMQSRLLLVWTVKFLWILNLRSSYPVSSLLFNIFRRKEKYEKWTSN